MRKKVLFGAITLAFVIMQSWFLFMMFHYPLIGINLHQNSKHEWIISYVDRNGVGSHLGARIGDKIDKINGQNPADHVTVWKWQSIEQAKSFEIIRDGVVQELDLNEIGSHDKSNVIIISAEILCFLMAWLLFRREGGSLSARYLAFAFIVIGFAFTSLGASLRGDALGKILMVVSIMMTPTVFLHFLIIFFRDKGRIALSTAPLKYLYGFIIVCSTALLGFFIPEITSFVYKCSKVVIVPYFIGVTIWDIGLLSYLYWKFRKENFYISTIIKAIWIALIISFVPFIVFSIMPQLLFHREWIDTLDMSWLILFFPISFAYLMATEKLYDIPNVVRRILFTALIATVPSTIVVVMAAMIFPSAAYPDRLAILFILTEALFTWVLLSLEYIITKLSKYMFPRKYQLQKALGKIASDLVSVSSFRQMKEIVLVDIVKALQVHGGAIVFQFADGELETITAGEIDVDEVGEHIREDKKNCSCCTVFPINRHEEYSSFLVVTEKKTKTRLVMEEREWLDLIITYLSVSLENIYLIRKLLTKLHEFAAQELDEPAAGDLSWLRKSMFELLEKERQRIANDLHDTTMQDLMFLKRKLVNLMEKYTTTEEDDKKLQGLLDYIEMINTNLRQSCFELYPHLLRVTGLVDTIEKIVDIESASVPFEIIFRPVNTRDIEGLDMDQKRHVFRIIQELLNNAKKHSRATEVTIELTAKNGAITLSYRDNGVGFDKLPEPVLGRSGVGMLQLKSRVLELHGKLDIKSKKGGGLRLQVSFPLQAIQTA